MKSNYKKLGQYIRQVDVRNTEGKEENLLGVSVQKQFIPSIANTVGTDFTKYKVVRKGQFTYIPDTSRRGDKIGIALLEDYDEGLVSNVYTVFEVIDENQLMPEYLMLWFSRPEFDRYARFKSHGSVREVMDWDEMCKVELPVPSIEKQRSIVKAYKAITDRIALKKRINDNLEQQAQAIFDNMFPNISNGSCTIGDYITPKRGKSLLSKDAIFGDVPVIAGGLEPSTYHNVANTQSPVLAISASGANAGYVSLWNIPIWSSDSSYIDSSMTDDVYFWYVLLKKRQKEIFDAQTGSAQPHIYPQHISSMSVSNLDIEEVHSYTSIVTPIFEIIGHHKEENTRLASLRDTLLPKLMSGELDVSAINL